MRGTRRGRRDKTGTGIRQRPWQVVRNPYHAMEMLSPDQVQELHDTLIRTLKALGIKVLGANVRALFAAAGARTDGEGILRIDESPIEAALASVPRQITLTSRNPARRVHLGGDHLVFGLDAGPPNVHDPIIGRRSGNLAGYQNCLRLVHLFKAIHRIGNQAMVPQELPANTRPLDTYLAKLTLSDMTFHGTTIGQGRAMDGIPMMDIARAYFLGVAPTMERQERAICQPMLSDRRGAENWALAGGRDAGQRATDLWQQALAGDKEPQMDPAIREDLNAYVAKRREEIGHDEP